MRTPRLALLALTSLLLLACAPNRDPRPYGLDELVFDGTTINNEGAILFFLEDPDPEFRCAGAVIQQALNKTRLTFIRAPVGWQGGLVIQAQVSDHGRHYVFIPDTHITPGTPVELTMSDGHGTKQLASYTRHPKPPSLADPMPADR